MPKVAGVPKINSDMPQHINHHNCCQLSWTVAGLSHSVPTFVYNMLNMTQSIVWIVCDSWDL